MTSKTLNVTVSDSIGGNEEWTEWRRLTFERPDIAHLREVICHRFKVDGRGMSIHARVTVRGREREYAVSSNEDLEHLWEEIEDLVARMYMSNSGPTRVVDVIFNGSETKVIQFENQHLSEITEKICTRFNAENCSLECTIKGDETRYSITSNEDVEEYWNDLEKLHVTGKKKSSEEDHDRKVSVGKVTYRIDQEPDENSDVVQRFLKDSDVDAIQKTDLGCKTIGTITNIMYYAAVGTGNVDMQVQTKDLGFKVIEICHLADNTVSSYVSACSEVNEICHVAVEYMLENDDKRALRVFASLAKTAEGCKDKTEALISLVDETMRMKLLTSAGDEFRRKSKAVNEELLKEKEKRKASAEKDIEAMQGRSRQSRTDNEGSSGAAGAAALGAVGAVAAAAFPPFAPFVFLGVAIGEFFLGQASHWKRLEEEERRRKEEESKRRKQLELRITLEQLSKDIENAKITDECFHALLGAFTDMRSSLSHIEEFFRELKIYCEKAQSSEERILTEITQRDGMDCKPLLKQEGFKTQLLYYRAKWVAMKSKCTKYRQTLRKTNEELHRSIEENPTRQQARAAIPGMAAEAKRALTDGNGQKK